MMNTFPNPPDRQVNRQSNGDRLPLGVSGWRQKYREFKGKNKRRSIPIQSAHGIQKHMVLGYPSYSNRPNEKFRWRFRL